MTIKERLLNSILSKETDRVPFSPFLAYYFDFLPEDIRVKGEFAYLKKIGADPLLRGHAMAFTTKNKNCSVQEIVKGNIRRKVINTKAGDLVFEYTFAESANTWYLTEYPVKNKTDMQKAILYFEDMIVEENMQQIKDIVSGIKEDGLLLSLVGIYGKSAFQNLLENFMGTQNLVYMEQDEPKLLEELLYVMQNKNLKTVLLTAESDAEAAISWEDSSTTNISPSLYKKYIFPEIKKWCDIFNSVKKPYVQHACGHIKKLIEIMVEENVSAIESVTPPPTGNIEIGEAFSIIPDNMALIGGIDPVFLLNESVENLCRYAESLIQSRGKHGFILSNSDSCPPKVAEGKFIKLAELVKNSKINSSSL